MNNTNKPLVLIILDGWGYREQREHNAIAQASTPVWDELWQHSPHMLLSGSGHDVGLPVGQMGNSEVGHLHIGAGRLMPQTLTRIDSSIADGTFFTNPVLNNALSELADTNTLHITGLVSPGGVHSHEQHIQAMIELAEKRGVKHIALHAILDGRDTPPKSATESLKKLVTKLHELGIGHVASIVGRYYAMDRDKRWERTEQAYDLMTTGKADYHFNTAIEALDAAYARGETDEFVKPTAIYHDKPVQMRDGDAFIFMNFRADRARQLTNALTKTNFSDFKRKVWPKLAEVVTLTEYATDITAQVAFPPIALTNIVGEVVANAGLKQLRIAETEKYAHVTFFFNGGVEKAYPHEDRELIPSPKVATYDLQPEMSANELTDKLVRAIESQQYAMIICNYANPDMVGHTGNFKATVQAIETIDHCLGRIKKALTTVNGEMLITSDHGNAECMFDPSTNQPHTAHTINLVPLVFFGRKAKFTHHDGGLYDIAPTMLYLLGLTIPQEMTGKILLTLE